MAQPHPISALEIVAYAERFREDMLPAIAPPVYRLAGDGERYLVPPFHETGGLLYNATEIGQAEFEDLVAQGRITLLAEAIPAKAGHELWFDLAFEQQYQPVAVAAAQLAAIAEKAIEAARKALVEGLIEEAEAQTGLAIRADSRRMEPFAMRAALRLHQGNERAIRTMKKLAPPTVGDDAFEAAVARYRALLPDERPQPTTPRRSTRQRPRRCMMYGVAVRRPQLAARSVGA